MGGCAYCKKIKQNGEEKRSLGLGKTQNRWWDCSGEYLDKNNRKKEENVFHLEVLGALWTAFVTFIALFIEKKR